MVTALDSFLPHHPSPVLSETRLAIIIQISLPVARRPYPLFCLFFRVEVGRMEAKTEPEKGTGVWHAVQPFIDPGKWGVARKKQ